MKKITLILIIMLSMFKLNAQIELKSEIDYLMRNNDYTEWLKSNNLNNFLSVYRFAEDQEDLFQLYLKFMVSYDSISYYWTSIDKKLKGERGYSLDKFLYFAGLNIYQIPADNFNIIIYDDYSYVAHDTVALYYDSNEKAMKSHIAFSTPKSQSASRTIPVGKTVNKGRVLTLEKFETTRVSAYSKIINYLKEHYENKISSNFQDNFTIFRDEESEEVHILVTNLKNQILEKESNPWVAELANSFFDLNIDWRRIEGVELKIKLSFLNAKKVNLEVSVDAKYGSGIWGVSDWDKMENYEPEFQTEVQKYANKIANNIKKILVEN